MAQEPDLALLAKMREAKADSLSMMLGNVYGTQAAMNHTTPEARQTLLKAFSEALSLDQQDEHYKDGVNTGEQFYRNSESVNKQIGIKMSRKVFAQTFLTKLRDTTTVLNMNYDMRNINM